MSERTQQADIVALLAGELPTIAIIGEDRGPTSADVDAAMASRLNRITGTIEGMMILVGLASEVPAREESHAVTYKRVFPVRILEDVRTNRPPGAALATGYDNSTCKTAIIELLHARTILNGTLNYIGSEPLNNDDGRVGHTISFSLTGGYASPAVSAIPLIDIAAGVCTLVSADDVANIEVGQILVVSANDGSAAAHIILAGSAVGFVVGVLNRGIDVSRQRLDGGGRSMRRRHRGVSRRRGPPCLCKV